MEDGLPLFETKLLEFSPSLSDNEVALGSAKSVSAISAKIGQVSLSICHLVENLRRQHFFAELRDLWADILEKSTGEEDWIVMGGSESHHLKPRAREHTLGDALENYIFVKLVMNDRLGLDEALVGA